MQVIFPIPSGGDLIFTCDDLFESVLVCKYNYEHLLYDGCDPWDHIDQVMWKHILNWSNAYDTKPEYFHVDNDYSGVSEVYFGLAGLTANDMLPFGMKQWQTIILGDFDSDPK